MLICLHLVKFRDNNQMPHQSNSECKSCCNRLISVGEVIGQYIMVLSANNPKKFSRQIINIYRSLGKFNAKNFRRWCDMTKIERMKYF